MFSNQQKAALAAPLSASNVKSRKQAGRAVSYIEGWKVIEEANRIFGFDAWSRETIDIRCVSERERKIGADKRDGWSVSYVARVRVTCGTIIREGVGAGHGIDVDCGQAHESAIKEGETDAMKRALMTFGNPFGLALYDKTQANVVDEPDEASEGKAHYIAAVREQIRKAQNAKMLADWWRSPEQTKARRDFDLTAAEVEELKAFLIARHAELEPKKAVA